MISLTVQVLMLLRAFYSRFLLGPLGAVQRSLLVEHPLSLRECIHRYQAIPHPQTVLRHHRCIPGPVLVVLCLQTLNLAVLHRSNSHRCMNRVALCLGHASLARGEVLLRYRFAWSSNQLPF